MMNLTNHTHKKLKANQIQDLPKSYRLGFKDSLISYGIDWFLAFAAVKIISISFGMAFTSYTPGLQSKLKILHTFDQPEIVGYFFIPTFFLYNFFSLFLDSRTYGMTRAKATYTFKKHDFKSSFYWSMARVFNFSSFGLLSSFINAWAMNRTQHQMGSHDFLYHDLTSEKPPVNLLHLTQESEEEVYVDERFAA